MNKKLLFGSAAVIAGFVTLTAFGGKTLKEQQAGITEEVTAKLEMFRSELTAACDARVAEAATLKASELMAAAVPAIPGKAPAKTVVKKKNGSKGNASVDPLPQPTAPKVDPKKAKTAGEAPAPNTEEKKSKTAGEAPAPNTDKKKSKTAGQPTGGGGK